MNPPVDSDRCRAVMSNPDHKTGHYRKARDIREACRITGDERLALHLKRQDIACLRTVTASAGPQMRKEKRIFVHSKNRGLSRKGLRTYAQWINRAIVRVKISYVCASYMVVPITTCLMMRGCRLIHSIWWTSTTTLWAVTTMKLCF